MVCKYLTPITSKKTGLLEVNTYQVFFSKILMNMQNLIQQRKLQRKGGNLLFSGHVMLVKFNPISSSMKYCFVKAVVIPQTRVNDSPYSVWFCIHDDGSILTRECGWVEGLILSCKHVFAIFHYIENEVTLRHNKTCTSKK